MMILSAKRFYLLLTTTPRTSFSHSAFSKNSSWERVAFQRGIKVWKKSEKNSSILSFKGEVVIKFINP